MRLHLSRAAAAVAFLLLPAIAAAAPQYGMSMYGEPALPPDFVSLPYANPDAPKGGTLVTGQVGSFDSLNPHILKGRVPWQLRFLGYESLMGRSWDEPFTLYGLLAESVELDPDHEWVEFTLRPDARFSDGSPVTVEDVLWSMRTLGTVGHPRYRGAWTKVARAEAVGERSLRLTFTGPDRELAMILGLRPVLKKAQWQGREFTESGLDVVPIATAPYVVSDFEAGRQVTLTRNRDYWGADLAFRRGTDNFDEIRLEFFADRTAMFEAFKAGEIDVLRETSAARWQTAYDFPAVRDGDIVKSEIPHDRPSGITGLVMNTRRGVFADWRVRAAMIHAFNFEFINRTLTGSAEPRITSYFSNSVLGMAHGPAQGKVRALLAPFADSLPPGAMEGYSLPVNESGDRANRANLRTAFRLLKEAGWTVGEDGVMRDAEGAPLRFEILLEQGAQAPQKIVDIYAAGLKRLGIAPRIAAIDSAQYQQRTDAFDFDMTWYRRGLSLSPGNEQYLYWGSEAAGQQGSRNLMGLRSKAVDGLIGSLLASDSRADFIAATKALDRVLTAGRYVIPIWFSATSRIAHKAGLHYPSELPIYGDWIGFLPDVWWEAP